MGPHPISLRAAAVARTRRSKRQSPVNPAVGASRPFALVRRLPFLGYFASAAFTLIALLLTRAMSDPHQNPVFFLFLIAVAVSSWIGGMGAGLFAVALSAAGCAYFVLPPAGFAVHLDKNSAVDLMVGLIVALATAVVTARLRSGRILHLTMLQEERALRAEHENLLRDLEAQAEALRRTADFNRQMIESSTDCIEILDAEGRLLYMNAAGQHLLEIPDIAPRLLSSWLDFWKDADRTQAEDALAAARSGKVARFQGFCATTTGIPKWWDVVITPIHGDSGPTRRLMAISRDMTDRKHAEEALIRSEKLASVGRMAATIAHEINNPLEAIMNALYLVRLDGSLSPQASTQLEIAEEELQRAAHITRQTLGFYRENGRPVQLAPSAILDEVVELLKVRVSKGGLKIMRRYRGKPEVCIVPGELRQVLSNLIANALDASPRGGALQLRVASTTISDAEPRVRITIADRGCGIAPEHIKHIFEPFFTTKESVGTGLGLWVTLGIVQKHQGRIRVRSRVGRGTVFTIYFPAVRSSTLDASTAAASTSA